MSYTTHLNKVSTWEKGRQVARTGVVNGEPCIQFLVYVYTHVSRLRRSTLDLTVDVVGERPKDA